METTNSGSLSPVKKISLGILLLLLLLLFTSNDTVSSVTSPAPSYQDIEWKLDSEVKGVEFYHAIAKCKDHSAVLIKLVNKNNYRVNVGWKEVFDTQNEKGVEGFLKNKKISIAPGETSEKNCDRATKKELVTQSHEVNPSYLADISRFSFKDITVSR